jgi:hypothetical protein
LETVVTKYQTEIKSSQKQKYRVNGKLGVSGKTPELQNTFLGKLNANILTRKSQFWPQHIRNVLKKSRSKLKSFILNCFNRRPIFNLNVLAVYIFLSWFELQAFTLGKLQNDCASPGHFWWFCFNEPQLQLNLCAQVGAAASSRSRMQTIQSKRANERVVVADVTRLYIRRVPLAAAAPTPEPRAHSIHRPQGEWPERQWPACLHWPCCCIFALSVLTRNALSLMTSSVLCVLLHLNNYNQLWSVAISRAHRLFLRTRWFSFGGDGSSNAPKT